jgi:hypothetical protein
MFSISKVAALNSTKRSTVLSLPHSKASLVELLTSGTKFECLNPAAGVTR